MQMANMGIQQMGLVNKQFLRKNRWLFKLYDRNNSTFISSPIISASRPKITFEEKTFTGPVETIKYNGRPKWEPITVVFLQQANDAGLYKFLREHFSGKLGGGTYFPKSEENVFYCRIIMLNGMGNTLESWTLQYASISEVDFGEIDYSQHEIAKVTMSINYARANVESFNSVGGRSGLI
jgi:hypothetical protein